MTNAVKILIWFLAAATAEIAVSMVFGTLAAAVGRCYAAERQDSAGKKIEGSGQIPDSLGS
jgi:hypothetical protein